MGPIKEALTFDDVTLAPNYSEILPSDVNTTTFLSKKFKLKIPLISSAMDTVTESKMAIAIAKAGGIGVIHRNLNIKKQILEIKKVKKQNLLVGAAVGAGPLEYERAKAIINEKVNLIVVDTSDAILVANRDNSQNIGTIIKNLSSLDFPEGKMHRKIYRPWGNYTTIVEGNRWLVKLIEVKPNASLSLQMHHHRAEHWVIVNGTALIEKNGEEQLLSENESTFIPLGCKHRLSNPGRMKLELIEVQSGAYLDEKDIIRFEDSYGRIKNSSQ